MAMTVLSVPTATQSLVIGSRVRSDAILPRLCRRRLRSHTKRLLRQAQLGRVIIEDSLEIGRIHPSIAAPSETRSRPRTGES